MTKEEVISKLTEAVGNTEYGKELIADLSTKDFESDAKYHQGAKDRLDERLGELKMWAAKDVEKGDTAKAAVDEERISIVEKAISVL